MYVVVCINMVIASHAIIVGHFIKIQLMSPSKNVPIKGQRLDKKIFDGGNFLLQHNRKLLKNIPMLRYI